MAQALAKIPTISGTHMQAVAGLLADPSSYVHRHAASALAVMSGAGCSRRRGDLPAEIKVQTSWGCLLDPCPPVPIVTKVEGREVWIVENLLSRRECATLLAAAESYGFGMTGYDQEYRGNLRLITTDKTLGAALWDRLRPLVPGQLLIKHPWDACGLNECFRLSKYHPSARFDKHVDESFMRNFDEVSMLTVNAYLNEGFGGGSTRFYFQDEEEADLVVTPKVGSCVLFRQPMERHYVHDGEEVSSGLKYLLRSDVMYTRKGRKRAKKATS